MKRRLLNLLTALSLLLCVATATWFLTSVWYFGLFCVGTTRMEGDRYRLVHWEMSWAAGGVFAYRATDLRDREKFESLRYLRFGQGVHFDTHRYDESPSLSSWRHFEYARKDYGVYLSFPIWPLTLVFAALPAARLYGRLRRRRRHRAGLCPACGYDLRATPGQCPECGYTRATNT